MTLTYTRPANVTDVTYHVEVSDDLKTWLGGNDHVVTVSVTQSNGAEVVVVRDAHPFESLMRRQMRLRVMRPLDEI